MDSCKTFVLVVGDKTNTTTAGSCRNCSNYNLNSIYCKKGIGVSCKSFIQFECDKAIRDRLKIVVLYHSKYVHKFFCPESVRNTGEHIAMIDGDGNWNYKKIRDAIMN